MGLRKGKKQIYWERLRANRSKIVAANLSGINMLECYHLSAMSLPLSLTHTPRMVIPHCPSSDLAASHWNHTVQLHAAAHIKNSWTAESAALWVDQYRKCHFCLCNFFSFLLCVTQHVHFHQCFFCPLVCSLTSCAVPFMHSTEGERCASLCSFGFKIWVLSLYVCRCVFVPPAEQQSHLW